MTMTMTTPQAFGTVFKGTYRRKTVCAIKTMRVSKISKQGLTKFKRELILMCPLHHPHLVKLIGGVWNEGADQLCIVLEYCVRDPLL